MEEELTVVRGREGWLLLELAKRDDSAGFRERERDDGDGDTGDGEEGLREARKGC